jgi:glycosyltransferase involved in cell wall biosynthesis
LPSEIGAVAIQAAEELGKPYAIELVTCTWDALWNYGTWQAKAYAPVSWLETRRLVRRAPNVFYVTKRFLQRRYPTTGNQVGVSDVEIDDLSDEILARRLARIERPSGPFVLGLIGYLNVRFKGIHVALRALRRAREHLPEVTFRVLGTGDPAEMQALAHSLGVEDIVRFDGTLPADRVPAWLDGVDLYLQPSFQEGLPRALVEAMSRACPALGSTAGGIPELLEGPCLHEPGDDDALARALIRTINDPELLKQAAVRNFEVAGGFRRSVLEAERNRFWSEFASSVVAGEGLQSDLSVDPG